jgi:hypothetical protein
VKPSALRFGDGAATTVLVLPALFEEANRMRRFTVSLMRDLAAHDIGTILPDLPGQGESLAPLQDVRLADWHTAIAAITDTLPRPLYSIAIRGGAILDGGADHRWRLAPESGERVLRDMVRATALSRATSAGEIDREARTQATRLAGNLISPAFYADVATASVCEGNSHEPELVGQRLWRNAEPGEDAELLASAIADIVSWIETCAAS